MSRKRVGVTLDNIHDIDIYFKNLFKSNRVIESHKLEDLNKQFEAKESFLNLPEINWKNKIATLKTIQVRAKALEEWVKQYIPKSRWERCLKPIRQNKSRRKLRLKRIDLPNAVYQKLKTLSTIKKSSINGLIDNLASAALQRIGKNKK
jgi:macrodomain Ter protein organizer (MatP/YcbG family)